MLHPLAVLPFHVKTASVAGMTCCRAVLFDSDDNRIRITVGISFDHILRVAGFLALHPVFIPGSAEKPGFAGFKCKVQRFFIHESHHKNITGFMILYDRRNKSVHLVKIDGNHFSSPFPVLKFKNKIQTGRVLKATLLFNHSIQAECLWRTTSNMAILPATAAFKEETPP